MLSPERVERYCRDGFLVVENVLDRATVDELRAVTDAFAAGAKGLTAHNEIYDLEDSHRPDRPRVRRIKRPFLHHKVYDRVARDRRLIDIVVALIGPDVRLQSGILNFKSPEYGAPVEWHQDWVFYPHTNDDLLALGIFLDDVRPDNGPVMFLPGTHRGPVYDHHHNGAFVGALRIEETALGAEKAIMATGPAGSISVHHCRVVHGSALNASPHLRRVLYYEYNAADAFPILGLARQYGADPETDFDIFNSRIVAGKPTNRPRLEKVPVQLPLPKAKRLGSIYENQTGLEKRHFPAYAEPAPHP
jgi:ectoine hydroxylase-related dioxygenase (phytanoyl-CoA dioxygenase family)